MLFGIQSSQEVKLSNIARSLQENIALIRTEKRLSRKLKSVELERELTPQLARIGSSRVQPNTVLALDLSDIRKEYAQKMEHLAIVRDGSKGELHQGYWLCDVTAAEVNCSEIAPLYQKLFSVEAEEFNSENAEILAAVDLIRTHTEGRGIWAIDSRRRSQEVAYPRRRWRSPSHPVSATSRSRPPPPRTAWIRRASP